MKLAVFTAQYPARVTTFFERDMHALLDAGVDLEIFSIYPYDESFWRFTLDTQQGDGRLRERVRHLSGPEALRGAVPTMRRQPGLCARQASTVLPAATRYGPSALAKTAYVLPKAWTWAATRANDFDHVLAYWGNYAGTCAWAFHQVIGRKIPFSIWLHAGTDLYRAPIHLRAKMLYADNIITCCEFNRTYMQGAFEDMYPAIDARLHICHHGLDLAEYPFVQEGREPRRILAVGRLGAQKGFDYLLRAIALLRSEGESVHLHLAGGGELHEDLEGLARALGISEHVTFHGWLEHPKVRALMQSASVLVHPSDGLGDGLPNVVREAMALGTPVIASAVAGIPDALGDGRGFLVPPRDPRRLADVIRTVLAAPERRTAAAAAARRKVEADYDVGINGRRLAALLSGTTRREAAHA